MSFKPFFVHHHRERGTTSRLRSSPRGFTAYVTPDKNNPRNACVQGTWCSNSDEFNKRTGRDLAMAADKAIVALYMLPNIFVEMGLACNIETPYHRFDYVLRHVV